MTKRFRAIVTAAICSAAMLATGGVAMAADAQTCQPGLIDAFNGPHHAQYLAIAQAMAIGAPRVSDIQGHLAALHDQATYDPLLADAMGMAAKLVTGRVVVALPDGTVVVDTSKGGTNTYANFLAKSINENHNSRVSFMAAQHYPCGAAVETKLSTTDGTVESYVALRLGTHLDSFGTVRMSTKQ